jgi:hypothetical protein
MLGNSGKPVTLKTSRFMKFVKWVFRNIVLAKIGNLEPAKPRSRELAKNGNLELAKLRSHERADIWNLEPVKLRSRELAKTRSHEPAKSRNRESAKFGNLPELKFGSHGARRFPERGDSRISKKQSQRRRLKKSGFGVWTSGRLVNIWDVKDIHVHVHTRNILWVQGCFRNVKVSSSPSPYKRGREGTCKGIPNFWGLSSLWEILCLLLGHCCTGTCLLYFLSCSGIPSEFSDAPNICYQTDEWKPNMKKLRFGMGSPSSI